MGTIAIFTDIIMPNGPKQHVQVLPVTGREPTCKICKKKIRFVKTHTGSMFPIMRDEENWYAHFPNACKEKTKALV